MPKVEPVFALLFCRGFYEFSLKSRYESCSRIGAFYISEAEPLFVTRYASIPRIICFSGVFNVSHAAVTLKDSLYEVIVYWFLICFMLASLHVDVSLTLSACV